MRENLGRVVGSDGKNATINGKESIDISAGANISIEETSTGIRISSIGGGSEVVVVQETGNSTTSVMSQNAVTEELNKKQSTLTSEQIGNINDINQLKTELSEKANSTNVYTKEESDSLLLEKASQSSLSQEISDRQDADNALLSEINTKQEILVSGESIKTINGQTILGSGNITISGGGDLPSNDNYSVLHQGSFVDMGKRENVYQPNFFGVTEYVDANYVDIADSEIINFIEIKMNSDVRFVKETIISSYVNKSGFFKEGDYDNVKISNPLTMRIVNSLGEEIMLLENVSCSINSNAGNYLFEIRFSETDVEYVDIEKNQSIRIYGLSNILNGQDNTHITPINGFKVAPLILPPTESIADYVSGFDFDLGEFKTVSISVFAQKIVAGGEYEVPIINDFNNSILGNKTDISTLSSTIAQSNLKISAIEEEIDGLNGVKYTQQNLSVEQQNQAKTNIGIGNVDNTSDLNKPVSLATQQVFDTLNSSIPTNNITLINGAGYIKIDVSNLLNYYNKTEIDGLVAGAFKPRGSKDNYEEIEAIENPSIGDVWNDLSTGDNYVYTENGWDKLSGVVDLSSYALKTEIPTNLSQLTNNDNYVQDANYVHTDVNFTTEKDTKLNSLENYNDTEIRGLISENSQSVEDLSSSKQDSLISGENIKTINGQSLVGSGDIVVGGSDLPTNNNYSVLHQGSFADIGLREEVSETIDITTDVNIVNIVDVPTIDMKVYIPNISSKLSNIDFSYNTILDTGIPENSEFNCVARIIRDGSVTSTTQFVAKTSSSGDVSYPISVSISIDFGDAEYDNSKDIISIYSSDGYVLGIPYSNSFVGDNTKIEVVGYNSYIVSQSNFVIVAKFNIGDYVIPVLNDIESNLETKVAFVSQTLTTSQKQTARENIDAIATNALDNYYTKTQVDGKLETAIDYKGKIATYEELLLVQNPEKGDMYYVEDKSAQYVWNGTEWENIGGLVDLSQYATIESVDTKLLDKVDKVSGKTLTTNDFTNNLKSIVESALLFVNQTLTVEQKQIARNNIGASSSDYSSLTGLPTINGQVVVGNKSLNDFGITIPINVSQLTNDVGYITKSISDLINYYTKPEVDSLLGALVSLNFAIVEELPTTDISTSTIYLMLSEGSSSVYEMNMYIGGSWSKLGTTEIDLSNFYTKAEVDAKLDTKQNAIVVKTVLDENLEDNTEYNLGVITEATIVSGSTGFGIINFETGDTPVTFTVPTSQGWSGNQDNELTLLVNSYYNVVYYYGTWSYQTRSV